jgi:hypothetical protein
MSSRGLCLRVAATAVVVAGAALCLPACANTLGAPTGDPCEPYLDAAGEDVVLRWQNQRATSVYVWGPTDVCRAGRPDFALFVDGARVDLDPLTCGETCEALRSPEPAECADCPSEPVYRVGPGATFEYVWASGQYVEGQMPLDCYDEAQAGKPCFHRTRLAEATYEVRMGFLPEGGCTLPASMGGGPCTCSGDVCQVPDGFEIQTATEFVRVTVDLPSTGAVEAVIE